MLQISIPGFGDLVLEYLVVDFNGTLSCDGRLLPGVRGRLRRLSQPLAVHVLTADTFKTCAAELARLPVQVAVMPPRNQDRAKAAYIKKLGPRRCVCIGNGRNDVMMLKNAALGIAVINEEGAAAHACAAADIITRDILSALDLLTKPKRLVATLRV
ncbi:MAG: HAD hydrolase family protein [Desulfobacterota bacterium]|nr:HAD hydrolase family protein [Thermodesulfobacteriota bacterium]